MTESPEIRPEAESEALTPEEIVEMIRRSSQAGVLVPVEAVLQGEGEAQAEPDLTAYPEVKRLVEGERTYLYSDQYMTDRYAVLAAQAAAGDVPRLIAETVRFDSETYPRPTPVEVFSADPYRLTEEQFQAALAVMARDERYADIQGVTASDGAVFLFSTTYLGRDHAEGLAEWLAVGQFDSP
jgi:hypothetical protein